MVVLYMGGAERLKVERQEPPQKYWKRRTERNEQEQEQTTACAAGPGGIGALSRPGSSSTRAITRSMSPALAAMWMGSAIASFLACLCAACVCGVVGVWVEKLRRLNRSTEPPKRRGWPPTLAIDQIRSAWPPRIPLIHPIEGLGRRRKAKKQHACVRPLDSRPTSFNLSDETATRGRGRQRSRCRRID